MTAPYPDEVGATRPGCPRALDIVEVSGAGRKADRAQLARSESSGVGGAGADNLRLFTAALVPRAGTDPVQVQDVRLGDVVMERWDAPARVVQVTHNHGGQWWLWCVYVWECVDPCPWSWGPMAPEDVVQRVVVPTNSEQRTSQS